MTHPAWMRKVRRGDILRSGRGTLRVVREVNRRRDGSLHSVTFTIRHCSWTGRCYTTYMRNDLLQFGFKPTGRRVSLRKKIDRQIAQAIRASTRTLTCCDVAGVS